MTKREYKYHYYWKGFYNKLIYQLGQPFTVNIKKFYWYDTMMNEIQNFEVSDTTGIPKEQMPDK